MAFQVPISIDDAISRIRERRLLLPAIQREFIWGPKKVEWLFDSLLQGYPFGSFLFWEVRDQKDKDQFRYYEFLVKYRERYVTHNPEFPTRGHGDFNAVLDGQQRLTALYIGLTGTYAYKLPGVWWEDNEFKLPTRKLYLNVEAPAVDDDEEQTGRRYEFRFLTQGEYERKPERWFAAGEILKVPEAFEFNKMLKEKGLSESEFASRALSKLHAVVHTHKLINYYLIQKADMERALNVFVRVNSGGEPLSLSDMLMSTAIANWKVKDASKEIRGLVDQIFKQGFSIDKNFVLKACLYLYGADIRYRVANFSAAQVKPFEDNWEGIQQSILEVFGLNRNFGYSDRSLTSNNALLPIVYWTHHKALQGRLTSEVGLRSDRDCIRRWLHVVLLKRIFGTSADTILSAVRKAFLQKDTEFGKPFIRPDLTEFPVEAIGAILKAQGKDPSITDEFIDLLLCTQCGQRDAFSILALLAPNLDYRNAHFHEDHLHPSSAFKKRALLAAGVPESELEFYLAPEHSNSILNLRHLDSNENKSKQDTPLFDWVTNEAQRQNIDVEKFCLDRDLPTDLGILKRSGRPGGEFEASQSPRAGIEVLKLSHFRDFIEARRVLLRERLREALQ